ncbi:MAG: ATP-binding protein [Bacteroidota bacterium]
MKRKYYPYLISILLIFSLIGAAATGLFAYRNIRLIVDTLQKEALPHANLSLINQIGEELQNIEHQVERYVFTDQSQYLDSSNFHVQNALTLLEKLKGQMGQKATTKLIDSTKNLILAKQTILLQVAKLDYASLDVQLDDFTRDLNKIPVQQILPDTILRKKKGFLNRVFGRKEQVLLSDTVDIYRSKEYRKLVSDRLDSVAERAQKAQYKLRLKEFSLERDHQEMQTSIESILSSLEAEELLKLKGNNRNVQLIAFETNRYIQMVSIAGPALLLTAFVILIFYIIRTRQYQSVLGLAKANAVQTAQEKERFLNAISHEIRTPMNAVTGFTKQLLKGDLNREQREQLEIIDGANGHINHLIDEVLDHAKLKADKVRLQKVSFNPAKTLLDVIKLMQGRASTKGLGLELNFDALPEKLLGDPFRLKQILLNLVSNAIKFTERGEIQVSASALEDEGDQMRLEIQVSDSGIGISEQDRLSIFTEFGQSKASDQIVGTGLGLTITKNLVELHGGSISVQSTVNKGSIFSVVLPYQKANKEKVTKEKLKIHSRITGLRILIADDEDYNRKLLESMLVPFEVDLQFAKDGNEAYKQLTEGQVDIALLDIRMPGLSGIEIAKKIREQRKVQKLYVLGITAAITSEDRIKAVEAGIDRILMKPIDEAILLSAIEDRITTTSRMNDSNPPFSLENLEKMGDVAFVRDMISTFIKASNENIKAFQERCDSKEWAGAGEALHKIIAPARHFKAEKLVALLKEHEQSCLEGMKISERQQQQIVGQVSELVDALDNHLKSR